MFCGLLSNIFLLIPLFCYNPQEIDFSPDFTTPYYRANFTGNMQSVIPCENRDITVLVVRKKRLLRTTEINKQIALVFQNFEKKIDNQLTPEAAAAPVSQVFFTLINTMKKCKIDLEGVD